jgi:hypothetical protein
MGIRHLRKNPREGISATTSASEGDKFALTKWKREKPSSYF